MSARVPLVPLLVLLTLALPVASAGAIDIRNFAFSPARLEVAPGEMVNVTNHDAAPHSVRHAQFNSGVLDQSETGNFTAPSAPGEYAYDCGVHGSSMRGVLVVKAANATNVTNDTPPATTTPATTTPATTTPATTTPATTTPATTTPATTTPATTTPATTTPATTTPRTTTPATTTPTGSGLGSPVGSTVGTTTPPAEESEADAPGPGLAMLLAAAAAGLVLRRRKA